MIAALIPAKSLDEAKGRLAGLLSEDERRQLALAMLEDIVRTLQAVSRIDSISIVSPDAEVLGKARELGANAIEEPSSVRGINQALSHGAEAISGSVEALLVVLADVPAVTPAEIDVVIDAMPSGKGLVICPSATKGTSALALRPPGTIPFRFGQNSFSAHKREALASGLSTKVVRFDSLSHDIDEPDNLRELLAHPAETATHRLLAQMRVGERLG